jgi:hypothetical protein
VDQIRLLILALLLFFISNTTHAVFLVPENTTYLSYEAKDYRVVFSEEYLNLLPLIVQRLDLMIPLYNKEYHWRWDEKPTIILASTKNQLTNGFATQYPRLFTTLFPGGPDLIDEFSIKSWLDILLVHEVAHLYQVNTRQEFSSILKRFLGNAPPNLPITYMITPHIFTPRFLIEGNAVLNETRFNNGGRLYSPLYRALTLQMVRENIITPKRLMNSQLDYPFDTEKYFLGGYLQAHIADTQSTEAANKWFITHTNHFINPFQLRRSFTRNFGYGYEYWINTWLEKVKPQAIAQKSINSQTLTTSYFHSRFIRHEGNIYFLTDLLKKWPNLCEFNPEIKNLNCKETTLKTGELLNYKGQWATSAMLNSSAVTLEAGIYNEARRIYPGTNGKLFITASPNLRVYFSIPESMYEPVLYKNALQLGPAHSTPFVSRVGDVYFFRQIGGERALIKNQTELFKVPGFSGHVIDVDNNENIYFVGATELGSTIFKWDKKNIARVTESDLAIDGMLINEKELLVAEITAQGFKYKVTQLSINSEKPILYSYNFLKKNKVIDLQAQTKLEPVNEQNIKKYKHQKKLEWTHLEPVLMFSEYTGYNLVARFGFSDPLLRHSYELIAGLGETEQYTMGLIYENNYRRLGWNFFAQFENDPSIKIDQTLEKGFELLGHFQDADLGIGFEYPIFREGFWNINWRSSFRYDGTNAKGEKLESTFSNTHKNSLINSLNTRWAFSPSLHWEQFREFNLNLHHRLSERNSPRDEQYNVFIGEVGASYDVLKENIFKLSYKYGSTDRNLKGVETDQGNLVTLDTVIQDPTEFLYISELKLPNYYELEQTTLSYKLAINWAYYFQVFPISLRRFAPFVSYSHFKGRQSKSLSLEHQFYEILSGVEFELLIFHNIPIRLMTGSATPSVDNVPTQFFARFNLNSDF